MTDLSVLIPARNEMFLCNTIQDILEHSEADTEIIAVLDGAWADPPIPDHERVTLIYHSQSIGQRAATNEAAKMARGKYVMKLDAHCSMGPGFDRILLADMQDDWTVVPTMRNLWAFSWVCKNGHSRYQGPSGVCTDCGEPTTREICWIAKHNPQSNCYTFDPEPHFQYFREFNQRPEGKGDITPTMSLQGSCFMMTKERYFDLNVCDESWGSWGSQGIEVAVKSWLSGGQVMVNHKTYYAHLFRTQGGDFSFPYPISNRKIEFAKQQARDMVYAGKFDKAIHPISWLIEKFWPIPCWKNEDLARIKDVESIR